MKLFIFAVLAVSQNLYAGVNNNKAFVCFRDKYAVYQKEKPFVVSSVFNKITEQIKITTRNNQVITFNDRYPVISGTTSNINYISMKNNQGYRIDIDLSLDALYNNYSGLSSVTLYYNDVVIDEYSDVECFNKKLLGNY